MEIQRTTFPVSNATAGGVIPDPDIPFRLLPRVLPDGRTIYLAIPVPRPGSRTLRRRDV